VNTNWEPVTAADETRHGREGFTDDANENAEISGNLRMMGFRSLATQLPDCTHVIVDETW
jgi:hypothetical protein